MRKSAQSRPIAIIIILSVFFLSTVGYAQTTQSPDEIANSLACIPPGTIGCTDQLSRIRLIDTLKSVGILNSDVGALELAACAQSMDIYQKNLARYNSCPADQKISAEQEDAARSSLLPLLCSPILGGHGQYNSDLKSCECSPGYFLYENACISPTEICQQKYGPDVRSIGGNCTCPTGLVWNVNHTACSEIITPTPRTIPIPRLTPQSTPTTTATGLVRPSILPTKEPAQSLVFVRTSPTPTSSPTLSTPANQTPENGILKFLIDLFKKIFR